MPRRKNDESALVKKRAELEAAIAKLREEQRATERAIEADRYKKQVAWEARVGRLAWNAGFSDVSFEMIEAMFRAMIDPPGDSGDVYSKETETQGRCADAVRIAL